MTHALPIVRALGLRPLFWGRPLFLSPRIWREMQDTYTHGFVLRQSRGLGREEPKVDRDEVYRSIFGKPGVMS